MSAATSTSSSVSSVSSCSSPSPVRALGEAWIEIRALEKRLLPASAAVGQIIRRHRLRNDITAGMLADYAQTHRSYMQTLERGQQPFTAEKLAKLLDGIAHFRRRPLELTLEEQGAIARVANIRARIDQLFTTVDELSPAAGARLKAKRERLGLTIQTAAALGGISESCLTWAENGNRPISDKTLTGILTAFARALNTGPTPAR